MTHGKKERVGGVSVVQFDRVPQFRDVIGNGRPHATFERVSISGALEECVSILEAKLFGELRERVKGSSLGVAIHLFASEPAVARVCWRFLRLKFFNITSMYPEHLIQSVRWATNKVASS